MADNKSDGLRWVRGTLCILIAVAGTGYALYLRFCHLIETDAAFFGFTCLFIFAGIVVNELPRILEFSFKEGSVKLEVKAAEERIYAQVKTLKELSMVLADILIMHDLNIGRLSSTAEDVTALREWHDKKRAEVLALVKATPEEDHHLLRFRRLYDALDAQIERAQNEPGREDAINEARRKILEQLRRENAEA